MSSNDRAILRDSNGNHLQDLNPEEQAAQEWLAERGEVIRSQKMKKGRLLIIFRLKVPKEPPVKASDALNDECSLSEHDSRAIAGLCEEPTRRQLERWLGWGLLTS